MCFADCSRPGHASVDTPCPTRLLALFTISHTLTLQGTMKSGSLISWLQQCTDWLLNISQTIDRLYWMIVKMRSDMQRAMRSEADFSGWSYVNKYSCLKYKYKYKYPSLKYEYKYKY